MNTSDAAKSALVAILEQYIHTIISSRKVTTEDAINHEILPVIMDRLRPLGGKALLQEDYNSILYATNNLNTSKNVKKILDEYNNQIFEIMEGAKYESDE
tara:strand:- start:275 stop:574 length:300 start_codon:yes stop_codon:yes gene_type:complete